MQIHLIKGSILISFLLFSVNTWIAAQYQGMGTQELKTSAIDDFNDGKYSSAFEKFNELIVRYPKDGLFHYYSGICQYRMNRSVTGAINTLKFASSRPNVPYDVWYHLAEAYMLNYEFPEAAKAYAQFQSVATKTDNREKAPARKVEMADNAMKLTKSYNTVEIIASSLFSFADTNYIRQIKGAGGTLNIKPPEYTSSYEEQGDHSGFFFLPKELIKGEYIYFSGYGRLKKWGLDIHRVKILGKKRFAEPEPIQAVKSSNNEIFPYYDPIGEDLYFASEGFNSMGGYDIFKAHYKKETDSWSEPVNLGFPINSPANEYVFIPGADLGKILLITDRQGLDSMLTVYLLRVKEPRMSGVNADNEELKRIGKFGGIESIPEIVNIAEKGFPAGEPAVPVKAAVTRPEIRKDIQYSAEYQAIVKKALAYQFKADSLSRLAREARATAKTIPEPDQRWAIQTKIILWEKQSGENQNSANELYASLKKLENGQISLNGPPASIKKDTVINAITVYRFNAPAQAEKKDSSIAGKTVTMDIAKKTEAEGIVKKPAIIEKSSKSENQFVVLDISPYSAVNPFPSDIVIPGGAFYRIQLGVFSKKQDHNAFGGLSPVTAESVTGKSLIRYYAGRFSNLESAKSALNIVRSKGYKDAFIVAWYNGQKLAPEKVQEFEKRDGRE